VWKQLTNFSIVARWDFLWNRGNKTCDFYSFNLVWGFWHSDSRVRRYGVRSHGRLGFCHGLWGLAAIYDTLVELEEELGVKLAILAVRGVIFFGGFGLISELSGGNAYLTAAMTVVILTAVFLYSAKDSEPPRGFAEADWF